MSRRLILRMIAPIASISALLAVLGVASAWSVYRLQKDASDILALNVSSIRAAERLQVGLLEIRSLATDYLRSGDRKHLEAIRRLRGQTEHWLHEAERLATTPREQELIVRLKQGYERFFREFDRANAQEPPDLTAWQEERALVEEVLAKEVLPPAREYLDLNEDIAVDNSEHNQATTRLMVLALLLLGTCGGVAGLLAGYGIARGIARSIGQLNRPLQDAASKLSLVMGQGPASTGQDLPDLVVNLQKVAQQAGAVVERLHESQREALRAEQLAAVGQLAAGLAHELRNPLMSMKILVQPAAERGSAVHLSERDLEVLDEEISRLERLIQSFLDFARPPLPEIRPFELQGVLKQTMVLVSGRADRQGVRIEHTEPNEPVVIEADVGQVRQVFLNLLLNALDATPDSGMVTVQARREPGRDGAGGREGALEWVVVQVADTGRGLPPELGPRIFEPFVSTKETGLGLGLSICKRIVEDHGGELAATQRPGGGAVFTVRLPLLASSPGRRSSGDERAPPASRTPESAPKEARHADTAHCR